MKNSEKSAKTKTSKTSKNANPQVSKKTNKQREMDEKKIQEEKMQEEKNEQRKRVNALFPPMQKAFEEMQKEIQDSEKVEINSNYIEKYSANITSIRELINSPFEPIQYVLDKFFPRGELCVIYGDSSCGKSMYSRCFAFAIAYGLESYLGFKIDLPLTNRKVALAITEDSERSIKTLIQKQNVYFEPLRKIEEPVFDIISCCENGVIETLKKCMPDKNYDILIVDTPQDDILGSMNDNNVVREYLNQLSLLASMYDCTIICIHHKRKYTLDKAPSKEDLSGTRAFCDKPRAVVEMRWHLEEPNAVWFTPIKANYESNEFLKESYLFRMNTDTLTFENNGEKAPSNQIHLSSQKKDMTEAIKEKIVSYKLANPTMTQMEIAEFLREDFPDRKINQSQVSTILKSLKSKE
ncbi:MAG: AAA family ATPase [Bacteroidales bacterium]|nr:AAA family ATPase [Bacteroidales bacterium]